MTDFEPAAPVPDDKDWTFVLDRICPECGFSPPTSTPATWPHSCMPRPRPGRRCWWPDAGVRPAPQVWSPLEYACHVRDLLGVFAARVELMLTEDLPTFENWDPTPPR